VGKRLDTTEESAGAGYEISFKKAAVVQPINRWNPPPPHKSEKKKKTATKESGVMCHPKKSSKTFKFLLNESF